MPLPRHPLTPPWGYLGVPESRPQSSVREGTPIPPTPRPPHERVVLCDHEGFERHHASLQQFEPGPAVHLALDRLESVDLPLHWPVAPRCLDGQLDRAVVAAKVSRVLRRERKGGLLCGRHPLRQTPRVPAIQVCLLRPTHPGPGLCQEGYHACGREGGHVRRRVVPLVLQEQSQIPSAVAPDAPFGKRAGVELQSHRVGRHSNSPRNLQLSLTLAVSIHDRHVALVACLTATPAPAPHPGRLLQAGPSTLAKFRPSSYLELSDVLFHRLAGIVQERVFRGLAARRQPRLTAIGTRGCLRRHGSHAGYGVRRKLLCRFAGLHASTWDPMSSRIAS